MSIGRMLKKFFIVVILFVFGETNICCFHLKTDREKSLQTVFENSRAASPDANPAARTEFDQTTSPRINLNTATREELMRLPGIGTGLATRIIEYRSRYGKFRRPEHLLMVQGIGARRFAKLREFIETK